MYKKKYLQLLAWITLIVLIGLTLGLITKQNINSIWYQTLHKSPITPPNYVFGIVWTILYMVLGICGWYIWQATNLKNIYLLKSLFTIQLLLNWSWTPLFFSLHLTGISLSCIIAILIIVFVIIAKSYNTLRVVSLLLIPYATWLSLATYLNFYIWNNN